MTLRWRTACGDPRSCVLKIVRLALIAVALLLGLALAGAALFVLTFNPNQLREPLQRWVHAQTGRTLSIPGDLQVTIFPQLGVKLGVATLSEKNSAAPFLSVDAGNVSVALLPLLQGKTVIDGVEIKKLKLHLVRSRQGEYNFADLLRPFTPATPSAGAAAEPATTTPSLQFDISRVQLQNASITLRDEQRGEQWQVSQLEVITGRLGAGATGNLSVSATFAASPMHVNLKFSLASAYTIGAAWQNLTLDDMQIKASGRVADLTGLRAEGHASASIGLPALDLALQKPRLNIAIDTAQGPLQVSASGTVLHQSGDRWSLTGLDTQGSLTRETLSLQTRVRSERVEVTTKRINSPRVALTVSGKGQTPEAAVSLTLAGAVASALDRPALDTQLSGDLDGAPIKLSVKATWPSKPDIQFDLQAGALNLDRLLALAGGSRAPTANDSRPIKAATPPSALPSNPLRVLQRVNGRGRLRVEQVDVNKIIARQLDATLTLNEGQLSVSPLAAELFGGRTQGSLSVQANSQRVTLRQSAEGLDLAAATTALTGNALLAGQGSVSIDLAATGLSTDAIKRTVSGSASARLTQGALNGVDLAAILSGAQRAAQDGNAASGSPSGRTHFAELSASAVLTEGVATNKDLLFQSSLFRVQGSGTVNLPQSSLNYDLRVVLLEPPKSWVGGDILNLLGLTIPIAVTGPFDQLTYQVDAVALATGLARNRATNIITKPIEELLPSVGDRLKGLFGR